MIEMLKELLKGISKLMLVIIASAHATGVYAKSLNSELATTSNCKATPKLLPNTSLSGLADFWFGSPDFQYAILTATNARSTNSLFGFISNPHTLKSGYHVCIPKIAEAERLKLRFDGYLEAVHDMALAEPSEVVDSLDAVPLSGPVTVTVVPWVRADQAKGIGKPGSAFTTRGNMGDASTARSRVLQRLCS